MLADKLGNLIEVYIDHMVIKTANDRSHLDDQQDLFTRLAEYKIRHNPTKWTFRVSSGRFLGCMITHKGIKASTNWV